MIKWSSALHMCYPWTKEKNEGIQMQRASVIWEHLGHGEAPLASISHSQTWHISVFVPVSLHNCGTIYLAFLKQ